MASFATMEYAAIKKPIPMKSSVPVIRAPLGSVVSVIIQMGILGIHEEIEEHSPTNWEHMMPPALSVACLRSLPVKE